MPSTYVISGGGTGGHLTPGLAVADELRRRDPTCRIVFVGTDRPLEERMISSAGFEHRALPVESSRTLRRNPLRFAWGTSWAFIQARSLIRELQPAAVFGLGGFASVPTAWSAARRGVPLLLLEQNAIPGRATRWLCRRSTAVCASFLEMEKLLPFGVRVVVTGNPVRAEITALAEATHRPPASGKNTLLILGGSQGAESLNAAVVAALVQSPSELAEWQIVHQTGLDRDAVISESYSAAGLTAEVAPFFDDMPTQYAAATFVVSRAGATTLAELACVGLPAVLLPYPHATDNHQLANARVFEQAGAALLIEHQPDPRATAASLLTALRQLANDEPRRHSMRESLRRLARPAAASEVLDLLNTLARRP
jgi:UDP-N-acetylglucosamine--N-acetylmuramyl-(pentapeptide) pyrophosphoryl-undecaprenol N-acetylglucosamine transferase